MLDDIHHMYPTDKKLYINIQNTMKVLFHVMGGHAANICISQLDNTWHLTLMFRTSKNWYHKFRCFQEIDSLRDASTKQEK